MLVISKNLTDPSKAVGCMQISRDFGRRAASNKCKMSLQMRKDLVQETYTRVGRFTRRFCGRSVAQPARGRSAGAVSLVRRSAALPKPCANYDRGRPQKRLVKHPIRVYIS